MIATSKFSIGQQVQHKLLGYHGVIIDVDAVYSLAKLEDDSISKNKTLSSSPWYHVVMEDDNGDPIHTYLAEAQITYKNENDYDEQSSLKELSESIKNQLKTPQLCN
uniref:Heat shock protein HspQ n=1 Tax=Candidatus Aschnera chinzeii TaxID=1485666 RepID=A0AAT9G4R2_9ENTR|nr:MAG: heat shock protein HspQ [Candidatus Aschnera chinzeii]